MEIPKSSSLEILLVVAALWKPAPLQNVPDLAPDDGHLEDAHAVGGERVEPEEPPLPRDVALPVELLDADVVHVGGAVDGGAGVGLGEVQEVGPAGEPADLRGEPGEAVGVGLAAGLAQDAEAGALDAHQGVLAVLGDQVVLAVAEEGEVVRRDPIEKSLCLREVLLVERRRGHKVRDHLPDPL
jgi:hypothetical protein